jgi:kinesin family protein 2/24
MVLLEEVESPGSQIDAYVKELNELLSTKASAIATLQERLSTFDRHLREEEVLSRTTGRTQADG